MHCSLMPVLFSLTEERWAAIDELIEFVANDVEMKRTSKQSATAALKVGALSLIGGIVLGPFGIFIGNG